MKVRSLSQILTAVLVIALCNAPAWGDTIHLGEAQLAGMLESEGRLFEVSGRLGEEEGAPELELLNGSGFLQASALFQWRCNHEERFSLIYENGLLEFRIGQLVLAFEPGSGPDELYLACHAELEGSGVTLNDLELNGSRLGDSCWTVGPDSGDVLWISGPDLSSRFELSGTVNLAWIGEAPGPEDLSFVLGGTRGGTSAVSDWGRLKRRF